MLILMKTANGADREEINSGATLQTLTGEM